MANTLLDPASEQISNHSAPTADFESTGRIDAMRLSAFPLDEDEHTRIRRILDERASESH